MISYDLYEIWQGILPESACPAPGQRARGLGLLCPFGTMRLKELAQAHFEAGVVRAIEARWSDDEWSLEESQDGS